MKKIKLLSLILALAVIFAIPAEVYAKSSSSIYTSSQYTHNSRFDSSELFHGIDISSHNGDINWNSLKKTKTKFIIVRVGCRGYGSKGTIMKDKLFNSNIENAIKNGFEVGVYFYSQALNTSEAIEEANFVLDNIKGYKFTLPVYYDYEFAGVSDGRLDSAWNKKTINKSKMTDNALAFCKTIENAGYRAGIYASKYFFLDNLDKSKFEDDYAIWLAHYATKTDYTGRYQLWQYSAKGKVSGIDSYVDSNFMYSDIYSFLKSRFEISDISKKAYTGEQVKPGFKVYINGKELVKGEDYYITYSDNINIGTAYVSVTGINDYEDIPKATKAFSIVPPTVTGLKLEERGTNSLKVCWDKNEYADGYYIQVHRSTGWVKAGTTKNLSFNITDLATASNYKIRVRAYKTVDSVKYYSSYCPEIETATAPSTPTSLSAAEVKPNSLKLKWKKQSNASYYYIYKYSAKTEKYEFFKKVSGGKTNYLTISNLEPNTKYKFKVKAYKQSKDGELLKSAKSAAFKAYTAPKAPTISSAKSANSKRISVKWKKLSSVSGYQIMWSTSKSFSSNYKTVNASGASKTLTTAQSNKTYYVRVRAYKIRNDKKIYSPWSKSLSVKTK